MEPGRPPSAELTGGVDAAGGGAMDGSDSVAETKPLGGSELGWGAGRGSVMSACWKLLSKGW